MAGPLLSREGVKLQPWLGPSLIVAATFFYVLSLVRATLTVAPADVYYMLCLLAYTTVRVPSI